MIRKVIQIAGSTQLVSLPRKWSQRYGVKKGDELFVEEDGNKVVVSTEREVSSNNIEITLKGNELIHRCLSALYKAGYDEIKIMYESPQDIETIISTVNSQLVGFEIIEQGKTHVIIKQVTNISHSEFDTMLRRTFTFLVATSEECLIAIEKNDISLMKTIVQRDMYINKLTDYCRRAINKKESHFKHIGPGYVIVELLEKIGDGYKDLCKYQLEKKPKVDKQILEILSEINILLKLSQRLFYSFDIREMEKFIMKRNEIKERLTTLLYNQKTNFQILIYPYIILDNLFNLNGPIMALKVST